MTNIESFSVVKDAGLKNSNFLVWTGLGQSVPLKLRFHMPDVENIFDLENFKSHFLRISRIERHSQKIEFFFILPKHPFG